MQQPTVFIVDDDPAVRDSLCVLLGASNLPAEPFASARSFLESIADDRPGCLLLDVRMPEIDGLELQRQLVERAIHLPVIILTAHGDVPMAVQALRAGALDFIQKPFDTRALLDRIREALEEDARERQKRHDQREILKRIELLSKREREVLDRIVAGMPTKTIASSFGTSFNTVQNQRASILRKMQADSVADLVRMVMLVRSR
jgi:two-component system, LuxR family, response regulator FixJ